VSWLRSLPAPVRIAGAIASVVATASAVLSWDALVWAAGELHIDRQLTWLFPLVVDGTIGVATVAAFALRGGGRRVRAYVWSMLLAAVGCSVLSNGAHSYDGNTLHALGGTLPSAGLAVTLHLQVVLARHVGKRAERSGARASGEARPRRRPARKSKRVTYEGREMSEQNARKLRARARAFGEESDVA